MTTRFIRTIALSSSTALLLFAAASAMAQPAPQLRPGPAHAAPQPYGISAMSLEGQVVRWLPNPHGEIDALLLDNGALVRFPPHLDDQLVAVTRPGDRIAATGRLEANGRDLKAYTIRNLATGQEVVDTPPDRFLPKIPKHIRYAMLESMDLTGIVERYLHGRRGEINGVLLKGGDVVRFPPHVFYAQAERYPVGATFAASGRGSTTVYGRALEAEAIGPSPAQLQPVYR